MDTTVLEITTGTRPVHDLTGDAARFVSGRGDGLLHVFAPHATVGLALMETGAGSDDDLVDLLEQHLVPRDDRYRHAHGSAGHGADHVLPALLSPSVSIPVLDGQLALGTWQSLLLVDTNRDNPRREIRLSFLQG
ncbi:MAG: YjbQ family protein [Acidimicrobiales bacterium]